MFSYDPSWDFVPNYCKECKKQFAQEKEEKGEERKHAACRQKDGRCA